MRMFCLDAALVNETWPDYARHFERFERLYGDISADQVKQAALSGHMQIWGLQDAGEVHGVVTTEIQKTAGEPICVIRIACGSARVPMQERLLDAIGHWAYSQEGCKRVRFYGRPGWLKRFKRFRPTGVVAEWTLKTN